MSRCVSILVQITVHIPEQGSPATAETDAPRCPCCGHACHQPASDEPVAPGVTAEMLAFYREHPDSN